MENRIIKSERILGKESIRLVKNNLFNWFVDKVIIHLRVRLFDFMFGKDSVGVLRKLVFVELVRCLEYWLMVCLKWFDGSVTERLGGIRRRVENGNIVMS